jgi:inosose dehydratase
MRHEWAPVPWFEASPRNRHSDGREDGYHGLEPFRMTCRNTKQPPEVFKKLLDAAGIALATIGSGGQYLDAKRLPETIENNAARARYIAHFGCRHLKVNLSQRVGPENLSAENAKILARNLNEVGKRTADAGVKFAFHPHAWTLVERSRADMVMELTDRLVSRARTGGIGRHRSSALHYYPRLPRSTKDAEPKYNTARGWRGPAPSEEEHKQVNLYKLLGTGGVDFPAFFAEVRRRNYDGWVTMDFDMPRPGAGTVEEYMDAHKKYLVQTLKGQLRS